MKENLAKRGTEVYTMTTEQLGNWLKSEIEVGESRQGHNLKLEDTSLPTKARARGFCWARSEQ